MIHGGELVQSNTVVVHGPTRAPLIDPGVQNDEMVRLGSDGSHDARLTSDYDSVRSHLPELPPSREGRGIFLIHPESRDRDLGLVRAAE